MIEWTCTGCRRTWLGRALTACPACLAPRPEVGAATAEALREAARAGRRLLEQRRPVVKTRP